VALLDDDSGDYVMRSWVVRVVKGHGGRFEEMEVGLAVDMDVRKMVVSMRH